MNTIVPRIKYGAIPDVVRIRHAPNICEFCQRMIVLYDLALARGTLFGGDFDITENKPNMRVTVKYSGTYDKAIKGLEYIEKLPGYIAGWADSTTGMMTVEFNPLAVWAKP